MGRPGLGHHATSQDDIRRRAGGFGLSVGRLDYHDDLASSVDLDPPHLNAGSHRRPQRAGDVSLPESAGTASHLLALRTAVIEPYRLRAVLTALTDCFVVGLGKFLGEIFLALIAGQQGEDRALPVVGKTGDQLRDRPAGQGSLSIELVVGPSWN